MRENPYRTLTDWLPDPEPAGPEQHEVRRQLALVGALGYRPVGEGLAVHVPHEAEDACAGGSTGSGCRACARGSSSTLRVGAVAPLPGGGLRARRRAARA
ncbi:MAG: hypothetical protein R3C15_20035 [Thermoleophilia bacterium]